MVETTRKADEKTIKNLTNYLLIGEQTL